MYIYFHQFKVTVVKVCMPVINLIYNLDVFEVNSIFLNVFVFTSRQSIYLIIKSKDQILKIKNNINGNAF